MHPEVKYFICGHTSEGFIQLLSTNLYNINNVFILKHPSMIAKSNVLKKLATYYRNKYPLELCIHPDDKGQLIGIIIRDIKLAVFDEATAPDDLKQSKVIHMLEGPVSDEVTELMKRKHELQEEAYARLKEGIEVHDLLEDIYIKEMDFQKADHIANTFIEDLFKDKQKKKKKSHVYERFFGTNAPDGIVHFLEELVEPIQQRVFIKGRAGTGKSYFMKKVLNVCLDYGFDVELYRCSFDPKSIDMVLIRELDCCLFDSTAPHELFPNRENDQVIDFYLEAVTPGTDEKFAKQIATYTVGYKDKAKQGIKKLKKTKEFERKKEEIVRVESDEVIQKAFEQIVGNK